MPTTISAIKAAVANMDDSISDPNALNIAIDRISKAVADLEYYQIKGQVNIDVVERSIAVLQKIGITAFRQTMYIDESDAIEAGRCLYALLQAIGAEETYPYQMSRDKTQARSE